MKYIIFILVIIPLSLSAWTINLSWDKVLDAHTTSATGIYNILGDSVPELLIPGNKHLYCFSASGESLWSFTPYATYFPAVSSPVAADIDNDGALEVIVALGSNLMVFDAATGDTKWYFSVDAGYYIVSSPGVGDLNGDGFLEIIFAELKQGAPNDSTRKMWVLDHNGIDIWSDTVGTAFSDPTIGDIDHDGYMDFLIGPTYQGFRFWDFETDTLTETGHIEWQTIQHDIYRTGLYNFEDTLIGISERAVEHIKSSLTLFPNPACAYVNFHINTMDDNNSILVFDISGRMVTKVKAGIDGKCRLKVSDLPMGVYFAALHASIKEKKKFI